MVPEPVCTTAIANNATTSVIINKKSQETPARLRGVCCADALGAEGEGGGVLAGTGSTGGAKPSPVPFAGGGGSGGCPHRRGALGAPGARPRRGAGPSTSEPRGERL